jgi:hypothetical protein
LQETRIAFRFFSSLEEYVNKSPRAGKALPPLNDSGPPENQVLDGLSVIK